MKSKTLERDRITNRKQLRQRIAQLNAAMEDKEHELSTDLKEVHASLRPANLLRNAVQDLQEQPELRAGIVQTAADVGVHALIDKLMFRKQRGLKNYLISIVLKKIADHFILKGRINSAT